jgi:hypothetical protein
MRAEAEGDVDTKVGGGRGGGARLRSASNKARSCKARPPSQYEASAECERQHLNIENRIEINVKSVNLQLGLYGHLRERRTITTSRGKKGICTNKQNSPT